MVWSFREVLAATRAVVDPAAPALAHGADVLDWATFGARADALAAGLVAAGLTPGDKLAHYLRNSPAYITTSAAGWIAGLTHVNVNYRYTADELFYIFDNSDAAAIVYDTDFAPQIAELRDRLTRVKLFVEVGEGPPVNAFAVSFESLAGSGAAPLAVAPPEEELVFIYTGGTTGLPKGVMWRQADMFSALGGGAPAPGMPPPATLEAFSDLIRAGQGGAKALILPPLMHGAGYMIGLSGLLRGGCVVTAPGKGFDPEAALATIAAQRPQIMAMVGDAFGRPLLKALDAAPGAHDLSSLAMVISSGAMLSADVKAGLVRHAPHLMVMDALGSSEVLGMGASVTTAANAGAPTRFRYDPNTRVIDDDGNDVAPGSGAIGRIARGGPAPIGYYKDPEKSARTFVTIAGKRYVLPGDFATVEADGSFTLLGRGSQVINTGGEKVFVEEVEEALKSHPAVDDALVVGLPDPTFGQTVAAVVEAKDATAEELVAHVKARLAGYKAPRRIVFVETVPRAPNGKADYPGARALASAS